MWAGDEIRMFIPRLHVQGEHLSLFCSLYITIIWYQPITRRQILDSSKLKDFADNNLKFEENGRKLFKPVENTVGKGEIARYEQFLLFPQCFQKACFPGVSLCGNGLNLSSQVAQVEFNILVNFY